MVSKQAVNDLRKKTFAVASANLLKVENLISSIESKNTRLNAFLKIVRNPLSKISS